MCNPRNDSTDGNLGIYAAAYDLNDDEEENEVWSPENETDEDDE